MEPILSHLLTRHSITLLYHRAATKGLCTVSKSVCLGAAVNIHIHIHIHILDRLQTCIVNKYSSVVVPCNLLAEPTI